MSDTRQHSKARRRALRVLRYVAITIASLVVLLVVLLLLPPVRGLLLDMGVSIANEALPGSLTVADGRWPRLGTIELDGVEWSDEGDSLVVADRVEVAINLRSLLRKDIEVDRALVDNAVVSIPNIMARFSRDDEPNATALEKESSAAGFPRAGSLPGVPSIAVHELSVVCRKLELGDSLTINGIAVDGQVNLLSEAPPRLALHRVEAFGGDMGWRLDRLALDIDFDSGVFDGDGSGFITPDLPFDVKLTSARRDSFRLLLSAGADAKDKLEIEADGRLIRDRLDVTAINSRMKLGVPGTRALGSGVLGKAVAGLPDLERVTFNITSAMELKPFTLDARVDADSNAWLDELGLSLDITDGVIHIRDCAIALPGARVTADATKHNRRIDLVTSLRVDDSRWLAILAPGSKPPDPMDGRLDVKAAGTIDAFDVDIRGDVEVGATKVDRLQVAGTMTTGSALAADLDVALTTHDFDVNFNARVQREDDITADLSPIVVRERGVAFASSGKRGSLRYGSDRRIEVDNLNLDGTFGAFTVDAMLDSTMSGIVGVDGSWQHVPTALLRMAGLEPDSLPGLADAWERDAPYTMSVDATLDERAGTIDIEAPLLLPGPRNLVPLLPDSAAIDDLGPLQATFFGRMNRGNANHIDVFVDLNATEWIDSARVHIERDSTNTYVDSLFLSLLGIEVSAHGDVGDRYDLVTSLQVTEENRISRFVSGLPDVTLDARATIRGESDAPTVAVSFNATAKDANYSVPQIEGEVAFRKERLEVDLRMPRGVQAGNVVLTTVDLSIESDSGVGELLPLRVELAAEGDRFAWFHSLVVDTTDGVRVDVDTLATVIGGDDLRSRRPFSLGFVRSSGLVFADGLDLRGELGTVVSTGFASPDSAAMTAAVDLFLPPAPPSLGIPAGLWPDRFVLDVSVNGPADVDARLGLKGFAVGNGSRPQLDVQVNAHNDSLRAVVALADSTAQYIDATIFVPAAVTAYPPAAKMVAGEIDVDMKLQRFPLAIFALNAVEKRAQVPDGEVAIINGHVRLQGTTDRPYGDASIDVAFPDWPKLAAYRLDVNANMANSDSATSGVEGAMRLMRNNEKVLDGTLQYRGLISLHPYELKPIDGGLSFGLHGDSLSLAEFDPLVPVDVSLGGVMNLHLTGSGDARDPVLSGELVTRGLQVAMAQRARVTADSRIKVSGPSSAPRFDGNIGIKQGVIRIPDLPPDLHPVEGNSLLLGDSVMVMTGREDKRTRSAADTTRTGRSPDFDVTVKIPGNFWIRGKGLDLELAGDLNLVQKDQQPSINGELRAVRGTLNLLGRKLTLDEGVVTFLGGDEVNPALSVTLSTQINDTRVKIVFGGTVQEPRVFFTSEPEMDESDVMAVLLFGKPLDQLDDDQSNHMQKRTTEVVVALGAARLQTQMSEQLGVDVFSYEAGNDDDKKGSFTFGKYLNPQVLLSYVRSLDSADDSYVSLEYYFTGRFKVQSVYGKKQSGLGFGWSKDY